MRFFVAALAGFLSIVNACNDTVHTSSVTSTSSKILVIARDAASAFTGYSGLQGYGIPYEVLTVPSTGTALPTLNSSASVGNYGGIIIVSEVSYSYTSGFLSALTDAQFTTLYNYQAAFGVRMVRIDVYPGPNFGASTAGGCCDAGVEQLISFTNTTGFQTAGYVAGATVSSQGLYHYPATITDASTTWEIAKFGSAGTAAVLNKFAVGTNGTREQMVWFTSMAMDWNQPSNYLMHSFIHWMTRGLYAGFRRVYFNTQIDDVHLVTDLYQASDAGSTFRLKPSDLQFHKTWQATINAKLPAGSKYIVELGHNGNGNIENATQTEGYAGVKCNPVDAIEYDYDYDGPLEFIKPIGSGVTAWPKTPTSYAWSKACQQLDPLHAWITANLNSYAHISHTYTHEALNNVTFSDVNKEITFNQAWLAQAGISGAAMFSSQGLIPPAITGLHNGDAIRAFLTNGIKYVVGDNTRPVLMNQVNPFWALTSTVADNGYDGLIIVPRWATTIYFNCDLPSCTLNEWIVTSAGKGDFQDLLTDARTTNTRHLLGLHHDPFMFHQANLRADVPQLTVNGVTGTYSLLTAWTETVLQEMIRLVNWPIITIKHDDVALDFLARQARDACSPALAWNYGPDGTTIVGATVSANGNTCSQTIPVTFPGPVTSAMGFTTEQVGNDPLTIWVKLSGSPVTFTLQKPISIL